MRICMLTTTHKPFDVRIFYKEARSLSKHHEVVIIAPEDEKWEKVVDNVKVIAVKKPKSKLLHFITLWRVFREGLKQDCEVYHCHEPDSLVIGVILKILKRNKVRLVYDVHEYYPSLFSENMLFPEFSRKFVKFFAEIFERVVVKFVDIVITVDKTLYNIYTGFNKEVYVIPNYPRLEFFNTKNYITKSNLVVYVGGLSRYRGIFEAVYSIKIVSRKFKDVKLILVGVFTSNEDKEMFMRKLRGEVSENVMLVGWVDPSKIVDYIGKAKVCIAILQPIPRYVVAVPTKLLEYLSCSKPVVASDFPPIRKIAEFAKCGILVNPNNIEEIANAIIYLLENPAEAKKMGLRGRRFVEREMNWEKMEKKLIELYKRLR